MAKLCIFAFLALMAVASAAPSQDYERLANVPMGEWFTSLRGISDNNVQWLTNMIADARKYLLLHIKLYYIESYDGIVMTKLL